jgi:hypothetical protein
MCGRARLSNDYSEIKIRLRFDTAAPAPNLRPSWNIPPAGDGLYNASLTRIWVWARACVCIKRNFAGQAGGDEHFQICLVADRGVLAARQGKLEAPVIGFLRDHALVLRILAALRIGGGREPHNCSCELEWPAVTPVAYG